MSPHQAVAVAVRLFAVWLVIYLIPGVVGFYAQYEKQNDPHRLVIVHLIQSRENFYEKLKRLFH